MAPTNVLVPHWRMQFPRQPFTAPNIGRVDRKGRGGGYDLEGSQTYGVGGGKLWHQAAENKPKLQLRELVEVMELGRIEMSRKWKLVAGDVEREGE